MEPCHIPLWGFRRQTLVEEQILPWPVEIKPLRRDNAQRIRSVHPFNHLGDLVLTGKHNAPHVPSSGHQHHRGPSGVRSVLLQGCPYLAGAQAVKPEGRLRSLTRQRHRSVQAVHDLTSPVQDLQRSELNPIARNVERNPVDPLHAVNPLPVPQDTVHPDLHPAGLRIPSEGYSV